MTCATGMLVQVFPEPSLCTNYAYLCKAYGIPEKEAFLSGYGRVKNTEAGDDEQARLFLSRDLFDVNPLGARAVQFALHHRMFWNKKLMSVFLSMANEVRLVLKTGKP